MKLNSTLKVLLLYNIICSGDYTKNEIIDKFAEKEILLSKVTLNFYLTRLLKCNLGIEIRKRKNQNVYHKKKQIYELNFTEEDLKSLNAIKKSLLTKKDYNYIRETIRFFYKISMIIKNPELASSLLYCDYFSLINWQLLGKLEKHCTNKDIIQIDYITPKTGNKSIIIHADKIAMNEWSNRIYLCGTINNSAQFSYLPVDRIFMVEKVLQPNVPFKIPVKVLSFVINSFLLNELALEKNETLMSCGKEYATITCPVIDEFHLVQRLMSFCPHLYYVSDKKIKNLVKDRLENLQSIYVK